MTLSAKSFSELAQHLGRPKLGLKLNPEHAPRSRLAAEPTRDRAPTIAEQAPAPVFIGLDLAKPERPNAKPPRTRSREEELACDDSYFPETTEETEELIAIQQEAIDEIQQQIDDHALGNTLKELDETWRSKAIRALAHRKRRLLGLQRHVSDLKGEAHYLDLPGAERRHVQRIQELQDQLGARGKEIRRLNRELAERDATIKQLRSQIQETSCPSD